MNIRAIPACVLAACSLHAFAQQQADTAAQEPRAETKRAFGVLTSYRTVEGTEPYQPISVKRKFWIASKEASDYPAYVWSGAFAGLRQLGNSNPEWGQGMKGYSRRYAAAYADQAIGNMTKVGLFPSILHEDPRYFRRGAGSGASRARYALTRIFVARTDSGGWRFNNSEIFGSATAVAISNLYYPASRNAADNAAKFGVQLGASAFANLMKEFWPDIQRRWFSGRKDAR